MIHHLVFPAAQAAAHHVRLQLGPPAELHLLLVVPGQSGLTLAVYHQHKLDHLCRNKETGSLIFSQ